MKDIKATANTTEYYIKTSDLEAHTKLVDAGAKPKDLGEAVFPETRMLIDDAEKDLDKLMPKEDGKPSFHYPVNDYMIEEHGGGEGVHYFWITLYSAYDCTETWRMISEALGLNVEIAIAE